MFKKISIFILIICLSHSLSSMYAVDNEWHDGDPFVDYNNPAWRKSALRIDTENRDVYNIPFLYERYSEIPDNEQVVPYGYQPTQRTIHPTYSSFTNRHRNYFRSVIQDGYYYRNMRW